MLSLVDTLQATRQLEKAGFATPQAEAIVTVFSHAETRLATKEDIERLRIELTARMDTKIAEVHTEIAEVRTEIADVRAEVAALRAAMSANMNKLLAVLLAIAGLMFAALRMT